MGESKLEQMKRLAESLSYDDKAALVELLSVELRMHSAVSNDRKPQDLYGIWRGKFPEEVDGPLNEIRHEWEQEWPGVFER